MIKETLSQYYFTALLVSVLSTEPYDTKHKRTEKMQDLIELLYSDLWVFTVCIPRYVKLNLPFSVSPQLWVC